MVSILGLNFLIDSSMFDSMAFPKGFGGNEFRIITIANALALNVSHDLIKAFQYHDHLCPG